MAGQDLKYRGWFEKLLSEEEFDLQVKPIHPDWNNQSIWNWHDLVEPELREAWDSFTSHQKRLIASNFLRVHEKIEAQSEELAGDDW
ncbi:MAG: hypothetical protein C0605_07950 [Hyphomicrobiales bacterium]|nr:MAG: hypothetical protein C0605_07950 [Hyphomicrobiales bacterium]